MHKITHLIKCPSLVGRERVGLLLILLLLTACQTIGKDEQLIPVVPAEGEATALLVEFTGVGCANCPLAAEEAATLMKTYPEQLVVVAMHPASNPFTKAQAQYDYTCKEADDYYKACGGQADTPFPTGVVNFTKTDGTFFVDYSQWGKQIVLALQRTPVATLTLSAVTEATTREAKIGYEVKGLSLPATKDGSSHRLVFWLTESHVIGAQTLPDGSVSTTYEHNHILRGTLSSTDIILPSAGKSTAAENRYSIPEGYELANCSVVGVLMDSEDEVIAVSEAALNPQADEPLLLSIDGIGDINGDTTLIITDSEINPITGETEMGVTGVLAYNGTLELLIERENTEVLDQFCCSGRCISTNEEQTQLLEFDVQGISNWFTHLTIPKPHPNPTHKGGDSNLGAKATIDYVICYTFNPKGLRPRKVKIIYRY